MIPSSPAARHTANTRYGFAAASGLLSSILVSIPLDPGILTSEFWLPLSMSVLSVLHSPEPDVCEFTIGLVISAIFAVSQKTSYKVISFFANSCGFRINEYISSIFK